jgi:hypothetical protein
VTDPDRAACARWRRRAFLGVWVRSDRLRVRPGVASNDAADAAVRALPRGVRIVRACGHGDLCRERRRRGCRCTVRGAAVRSDRPAAGGVRGARLLRTERRHSDGDAARSRAAGQKGARHAGSGSDDNDRARRGGAPGRGAVRVRRLAPAVQVLGRPRADRVSGGGGVADDGAAPRNRCASVAVSNSSRFRRRCDPSSRCV